MRNRSNDAMKRAIDVKRTSNVLFAVIIIAICVFMLCSCNKVERETVKSYGIKYLGYKLNEEEDALYCYVYVTSSDDGLLNCERATWESDVAPENVWYNVQTINITVDPASIFSAVQDKLIQENPAANELEYNCLKVMLRYDTIYKSIKSDAEVTRSGSHYMHDFGLNIDDESYTATLTYRYANSASWYSVLIAAAVVAFAVGVTVYSAVKGKLCRKKTTER